MAIVQHVSSNHRFVTISMELRLEIADTNILVSLLLAGDRNRCEFIDGSGARIGAGQIPTHDLFCVRGQKPFPSGEEVHAGDPQSLAALNVEGTDEGGLDSGFGKAMVETNHFDDGNLKFMGGEGGKLMGRIWKW